MIRGGITRYQKLIRDAVTDNQESTTLYGIVLQQKYITKLSDMINEDIKLMISGDAGNKQTALKVARYASPLGIASLAGEAIYNVGKLGYEDQKRFNALSPEEQAAERAEQEKFAFDIEGA